MEACDHIFLSAHRGKFRCGDCGQIFDRLPTDSPTATDERRLYDTIAEFLDAQLTFREAVEKAKVTIKQFKLEFSKMLPKDFVVDGCISVPTVMGAKNRRVSDPELVDEFFSSTTSLYTQSAERILQVCHHNFPDVITVEMQHGYLLNGMEYTITYLDTTKQLARLA